MALAEREIAPQAQKRLYTEEEYLALEEAAEEKVGVCSWRDMPLCPAEQIIMRHHFR